MQKSFFHKLVHSGPGSVMGQVLMHRIMNFASASLDVILLPNDELLDFDDEAALSIASLMNLKMNPATK